MLEKLVYIVKLENRCLINCGILAIICLDLSKNVLIFNGVLLQIMIGFVFIGKN